MIAATSLALTGCATGDSNSDSDSVKLTMYYPVAVGGPLTAVVDGLIEVCEAEQPGLDVDAIYTGGYADTMTKTQTAARAGDGPDVAVLLSSDLYTLKDNDLIVPLDEIGDTSWAEDRFFEAFYKGGVDADGAVWSLPFQRSTIVQYHNKEIFAAAGLDPDAPPTTWDEIESISQQIVESGAAEYGIQIPSTQFGYWLFQALAIQAGVEITDGTGTATSFDQPEAVRALEFWESLGAEGLAPSGAVEWGTTAEDFLQGRTAVMWTTTGNLSNVRNNATFDFGVSPLPSDKRGGSPTGGGNIYVFKDADDAQRQAALGLLKCLTDPENAAQWSIDSGYVATGPAAWETTRMAEYAADFPEAAVARDQLEVAIGELATHEGGRVVQLANDAINSVLTGQAGAEEALEKLQADIESILKDYR